jgi:hypothetical protein
VPNGNARQLRESSAVGHTRYAIKRITFIQSDHSVPNDEVYCADL